MNDRQFLDDVKMNKFELRVFVFELGDSVILYKMI